MTREEAIKIIKEAVPTMWKETNEAIQTLVPEFKESNDERIRELLVRFVKYEMPDNYSDDISKDNCLAYLEKQSEQKPKTTFYMPIDNCEGTVDDAGYYFKEKEQKPVEWKPQPESLEALMYAIEGKWDAITPTSYLSRRLEDLYEGLVNTYHVDESFLAELPKAASMVNIEGLRELKRKIDASMEKQDYSGLTELEKAIHRGFLCAGIENVPVTIIKETAQDCLNHLKPAEWSEEDEWRLKILQETICGLEWKKEKKQEFIDWLKSLHERFNLKPKPEWSVEDYKTKRNLMSLLTNLRINGKITEETYQKYYPWFKSICPSWKPSEEQMETLHQVAFAADHDDTTFFDIAPLRSLYEQLKKL